MTRNFISFALLSLILCSLTEKSFSTDLFFPEGFHSFHTRSIAVIEPSVPMKAAKSFIIKIDDLEMKNDEELDKELSAINDTSYMFDLSFQDVSLSQLEKIVKTPFIKGLDLSQTYLDNEALHLLSTMSSLQFLDISDNRFDDNGLAHLSTLTNLVELKIASNKVTVKGINYLTELRNLSVLDASCTYLGNDGIEVVAKFKTLEHLDVQACGFGDQALGYFIGMPALKTVNISDNRQLTSAGVKSLSSRSDLVVKYN